MSTGADRGAKRQTSPKSTSEEKVGDTKDCKQAVKSPDRSYHETFEAHITLLRAEHHLNFPAVSVVVYPARNYTIVG